MSTHNICFHGEISQSIPEFSLNTHHICFSDACFGALTPGPEIVQL